MDIFATIGLGVVQGLTEFLPVSSTGHLILAREVIGSSGAYDLAFDAVLHLATAAAVIVYFWKDLWGLVHTVLRMVGRMPVDRKDATLLYALVIGTIPAVILGLSLETAMEELFRSPLLVAGVLVAGSVLFMAAEHQYAKRGGSNGESKAMTTRKGFFIGLFQSLALIPGMSRSGASIAGGMLLGMSRVEAARFAFLLAVPIMLGAGGKKLFELLAARPDELSFTTLGIGAAVAFVVGMAAIHFMLSFVRKYSLWPFIWYRIILAGFVVFAVYFG